MGASGKLVFFCAAFVALILPLALFAQEDANNQCEGFPKKDSQGNVIEKYRTCFEGQVKGHCEANGKCKGDTYVSDEGDKEKLSNEPYKLEPSSKPDASPNAPSPTSPTPQAPKTTPSESVGNWFRNIWSDNADTNTNTNSDTDSRSTLERLWDSVWDSPESNPAPTESTQIAPGLYDETNPLQNAGLQPTAPASPVGPSISPLNPYSPESTFSAGDNYSPQEQEGFWKQAWNRFEGVMSEAYDALVESVVDTEEAVAEWLEPDQGGNGEQIAQAKTTEEQRADEKRAEMEKELKSLYNECRQGGGSVTECISNPRINQLMNDLKNSNPLTPPNSTQPSNQTPSPAPTSIPISENIPEVLEKNYASIQDGSAGNPSANDAGDSFVQSTFDVVEEAYAALVDSIESTVADWFAEDSGIVEDVGGGGGTEVPDEEASDEEPADEKPDDANTDLGDQGSELERKALTDSKDKYFKDVEEQVQKLAEIHKKEVEYAAKVRQSEVFSENPNNGNLQDYGSSEERNTVTLNEGELDKKQAEFDKKVDEINKLNEQAQKTCVETCKTAVDLKTYKNITNQINNKIVDLVKTQVEFEQAEVRLLGESVDLQQQKEDFNDLVKQNPRPMAVDNLLQRNFDDQQKIDINREAISKIKDLREDPILSFNPLRPFGLAPDQRELARLQSENAALEKNIATRAQLADAIGPNPQFFGKEDDVAKALMKTPETPEDTIRQNALYKSLQDFLESSNKLSDFQRLKDENIDLITEGIATEAVIGEYQDMRNRSLQTILELSNAIPLSPDTKAYLDTELGKGGYFTTLFNDTSKFAHALEDLAMGGLRSISPAIPNPFSNDGEYYSLAPLSLGFAKGTDDFFVTTGFMPASVRLEHLNDSIAGARIDTALSVANTALLITPMFHGIPAQLLGTEAGIGERIAAETGTAPKFNSYTADVTPYARLGERLEPFEATAARSPEAPVATKIEPSSLDQQAPRSPEYAPESPYATDPMRPTTPLPKTTEEIGELTTGIKTTTELEPIKPQLATESNPLVRSALDAETAEREAAAAQRAASEKFDAAVKNANEVPLETQPVQRASDEAIAEAQKVRDAAKAEMDKAREPVQTLEGRIEELNKAAQERIKTDADIGRRLAEADAAVTKAEAQFLKEPSKATSDAVKAAEARLVAVIESVPERSAIKSLEKQLDAAKVEYREAQRDYGKASAALAEAQGKGVKITESVAARRNLEQAVADAAKELAKADDRLLAANINRTVAEAKAGDVLELYRAKQAQAESERLRSAVSNLPWFNSNTPSQIVRDAADAFGRQLKLALTSGNSPELLATTRNLIGRYVQSINWNKPFSFTTGLTYPQAAIIERAPSTIARTGIESPVTVGGRTYSTSYSFRQPAQLTISDVSAEARALENFSLNYSYSNVLSTKGVIGSLEAPLAITSDQIRTLGVAMQATEGVTIADAMPSTENAGSYVYNSNIPDVLTNANQNNVEPNAPTPAELMPLGTLQSGAQGSAEADGAQSPGRQTGVRLTAEPDASSENPVITYEEGGHVVINIPRDRGGQAAESSQGTKVYAPVDTPVPATRGAAPTAAENSAIENFLAIRGNQNFWNKSGANKTALGYLQDAGLSYTYSEYNANGPVTILFRRAGDPAVIAQRTLTPIVQGDPRPFVELAPVKKTNLQDALPQNARIDNAQLAALRAYDVAEAENILLQGRNFLDYLRSSGASTAEIEKLSSEAQDRRDAAARDLRTANLDVSPVDNQIYIRGDLTPIARVKENGLYELTSHALTGSVTPHAVAGVDIPTNRSDVVNVKSYSVNPNSPVKQMRVIEVREAELPQDLDALAGPVKPGTTRLYRGLGQTYQQSFVQDQFFAPDPKVARVYMRVKNVPGTNFSIVVIDVETNSLNDFYAYKALERREVKEDPLLVRRETNNFVELPYQWLTADTVALPELAKIEGLGRRYDALRNGNLAPDEKESALQKLAQEYYRIENAGTIHVLRPTNNLLQAARGGVGANPFNLLYAGGLDAVNGVLNAYDRLAAQTPSTSQVVTTIDDLIAQEKALPSTSEELRRLAENIEARAREVDELTIDHPELSADQYRNVAQSVKGAADDIEDVVKRAVVLKDARGVLTDLEQTFSDVTRSEQRTSIASSIPQRIDKMIRAAFIAVGLSLAQAPDNPAAANYSPYTVAPSTLSKQAEDVRTRFIARHSVQDFNNAILNPTLHIDLIRESLGVLKQQGTLNPILADEQQAIAILFAKIMNEVGYPTQARCSSAAACGPYQLRGPTAADLGVRPANINGVVNQGYQVIGGVFALNENLNIVAKKHGLTGDAAIDAALSKYLYGQNSNKVTSSYGQTGLNASKAILNVFKKIQAGQNLTAADVKGINQKQIGSVKDVRWNQAATEWRAQLVAAAKTPTRSIAPTQIAEKKTVETASLTTKTTTPNPPEQENQIMPPAKNNPTKDGGTGELLSTTPLGLANTADVAALNKYLVKDPLGITVGKLETDTGKSVVVKIATQPGRWDQNKFGPYGQHVANVLKAGGDRLASYNPATEELTLSRGLRAVTVEGLTKFIAALADEGVTFGLQNAFRDESAQRAAASNPNVASDHMYGFAADADVRCASCVSQTDLEKRIMRAALKAEVQQIDLYGFGVRDSSVGPKQSIYAIHVGWSPLRNGGIESTGVFAETHRNGYLGAQLGQPGKLIGVTASDPEAQKLWAQLQDARRLPTKYAEFYQAVNAQDVARLPGLATVNSQTTPAPQETKTASLNDLKSRTITNYASVSSEEALATSPDRKPPTEAQIVQIASDVIKEIGGVANLDKIYTYDKNGVVRDLATNRIISGFRMQPIQSAASEARLRAGFNKVHGKLVAMNEVMRRSLGQERIPFTSAARPTNIGSDRHHTFVTGPDGKKILISYAADYIGVSPQIKTALAAVASRSQYALNTAISAQKQKSFVPLSVGARYPGTPRMVHVDVNPNPVERTWLSAPVEKFLEEIVNAVKGGSNVKQNPIAHAKFEQALSRARLGIVQQSTQPTIAKAPEVVPPQPTAPTSPAPETNEPAPQLTEAEKALQKEIDEHTGTKPSTPPAVDEKVTPKKPVASPKIAAPVVKPNPVVPPKLVPQNPTQATSPTLNPTQMFAGYNASLEKPRPISTIERGQIVEFNPTVLAEEGSNVRDYIKQIHEKDALAEWYFVGKNCMKGSDCSALAKAGVKLESTDFWPDEMRILDITHPVARARIAREMEDALRNGANYIRIDNMHNQAAVGASKKELATSDKELQMINDVFEDLDARLRREGVIPSTRPTGLTAHNNLAGWERLLDSGLLKRPPVLLRHENPTQDLAEVDAGSRIAQKYHIPFVGIEFEIGHGYKPTPAAINAIARKPGVTAVVVMANEDHYVGGRVVKGTGPAEIQLSYGPQTTSELNRVAENSKPQETPKTNPEKTVETTSAPVPAKETSPEPERVISKDEQDFRAGERAEQPINPIRITFGAQERNVIPSNPRNNPFGISVTAADGAPVVVPPKVATPRSLAPQLKTPETIAVETAETLGSTRAATTKLGYVPSKEGWAAAYVAGTDLYELKKLVDKMKELDKRTDLSNTDKLLLLKQLRGTLRESIDSFESKTRDIAARQDRDNGVEVRASLGKIMPTLRKMADDLDTLVVLPYTDPLLEMAKTGNDLEKSLRSQGYSKDARTLITQIVDLASRVEKTAASQPALKTAGNNLANEARNLKKIADITEAIQTTAAQLTDLQDLAAKIDTKCGADYNCALKELGSAQSKLKSALNGTPETKVKDSKGRTQTLPAQKGLVVLLDDLSKVPGLSAADKQTIVAQKAALTSNSQQIQRAIAAATPVFQALINLNNAGAQLSQAEKLSGLEALNKLKTTVPNVKNSAQSAVARANAAKNEFASLGVNTAPIDDSILSITSASNNLSSRINNFNPSLFTSQAEITKFTSDVKSAGASLRSGALKLLDATKTAANTASKKPSENLTQSSGDIRKQIVVIFENQGNVITQKGQDVMEQAVAGLAKALEPKTIELAYIVPSFISTVAHAKTAPASTDTVVATAPKPEISRVETAKNTVPKTETAEKPTIEIKAPSISTSLVPQAPKDKPAELVPTKPIDTASEVGEEAGSTLSPLDALPLLAKQGLSALQKILESLASIARSTGARISRPAPQQPAPSAQTNTVRREDEVVSESTDKPTWLQDRINGIVDSSEEYLNSLESYLNPEVKTAQKTATPPPIPDEARTPQPPPIPAQPPPIPSSVQRPTITPADQERFLNTIDEFRQTIITQRSGATSAQQAGIDLIISQVDALKEVVKNEINRGTVNQVELERKIQQGIDAIRTNISRLSQSPAEPTPAPAAPPPVPSIDDLQKIVTDYLGPDSLGKFGQGNRIELAEKVSTAISIIDVVSTSPELSTDAKAALDAARQRLGAAEQALSNGAQKLAEPELAAAFAEFTKAFSAPRVQPTQSIGERMASAWESFRSRFTGVPNTPPNTQAGGEDGTTPPPNSPNPTPAAAGGEPPRDPGTIQPRRSILWQLFAYFGFGTTVNYIATFEPNMNPDSQTQSAPSKTTTQTTQPTTKTPDTTTTQKVGRSGSQMINKDNTQTTPDETNTTTQTGTKDKESEKTETKTPSETKTPNTKTPPSAPSSPSSPKSPTDSRTSSNSSSPSMGGVMGALSQLLGLLKSYFAMQPQTPATTPTTPTQTTEQTTTPKKAGPPIVMTLIAEPSTVQLRGTSKLKWSSVGASRCAVYGPGSNKLADVGPNGTITTPTMIRSTAFGVVCSSADSSSNGSHAIVITVEGTTADPIRVTMPESAPLTSSPINAATQGAQQSQPAQQAQTLQPNTVQPTVSQPATVSTCNPNQTMDAFILCLQSLK